MKKTIFVGAAALIFILVSCATTDKGMLPPGLSSRGKDLSSRNTGDTGEGAWSLEEARKAAAGIYKGVLPYPGGTGGLETVIRLRKDGTFVLRNHVMGRIEDTFGEGGNFTIDRAGLVTLDKAAPNMASPLYSFHRDPSSLTQLDKDGKAIATDVPERYVLKKFPAEITDTYWKLTRLYGKPVVWTGDIKNEPHLIMRLEGTRTYGHSGTNRFQGSYAVKGENGISFSPMKATMIASPNMQIEMELYRALREADSFTVDENEFTIGTRGREPAAVFEAR